MTLNFKSILKNISIGMCICFMIILFFNKGRVLIIISDALCVVGILYLINGLYRYTCKLHSYDLISYSMRKFFEVAFNKNYSKKNSKLGEYVDYIKNVEYKKEYRELIVAGLLFLVISLFFSCF